MNTATKKNIDRWLNEEGYDADTKAEIRRLQQEDPQALVDAFYTTLSFGTAGLRGIMGIGTNRMNVYTVRAASQGLANYILTQPKPAHGYSVFIGYDSRINSRLFAEESAKVLAGNGIRVYLYNDLRPTPLVSFGCRFKRCTAAIMVTASHNPKEYNGYKVYWSDGAQVLSPHDKGIIAEVNKAADPTKVTMAPSLQHPLIEEVGNDIDEAYLQAITPLQHYPTENREHGDELAVVYTSLHGTGITLIPAALARWGFHNVRFVEKQVIPDGTFPTVRTPNPEEPAALQLGIDLLMKSKGDLFIATDPDADRLGVVVSHRGRSVTLNGNQIACLCLEHICQALDRQNKMPPKAAFIKTIVTTELFQAICDAYHKPCFNTLPGFKYFGELIRLWERDPQGYQYLFGCEEAYGYLLGTVVRDKDAITACTLVCEAALQAKRKGKTLVDKLHDLYRKYGVFSEKLLSVSFPETKAGRDKIASGMLSLRESALKEIDGIPVKAIEDSTANLLRYRLADGSVVTVRPSGTEPKVKLYCEVVSRSSSPIDESLAVCNRKAETLLHWMKNKFLT